MELVIYKLKSKIATTSVVPCAVALISERPQLLTCTYLHVLGGRKRLVGTSISGLDVTSLHRYEAASSTSVLFEQWLVDEHRETLRTMLLGGLGSAVMELGFEFFGYDDHYYKSFRHSVEFDANALQMEWQERIGNSKEQ